MTQSQQQSPARFGSALAFGILFVLSALLSVLVYETRSEWPAGFDGFGAAAFAIVGLALLGLAVRSRRTPVLS